MNARQNSDSFLLAQFREFYTEVIRLKQLVKSDGWDCPPETSEGNGSRPPDAGTWVFFSQTAAAGDPAGAVPVQESLAVRRVSQLTQFAPEVNPPSSHEIRLTLMVWQSLRVLFDRNAAQVMRLNGVATENYLEAQYLMAAFADEVFIHLDWPGRRIWTSHLLETALFHSHVAGELFFEKLDWLLAQRDPAQKGLAAIYLNILSLGFRGKYDGLNDQGRLSDYRRQLFAFVFQRPSNLNHDSKIAFPQAYGHKLAREPKKKLTNPRLWVGVFGLVLVGYLAISHVVWLTLTSRLEKANQEIVVIQDRLRAISVKR